MGQSSIERFYCRPIAEREPMWDTQTCATTAYTDKGKLAADQVSLYPPRQDVEVSRPIDHDDVSTYPLLNPFDAVSQATPPGHEPFRIDWQILDSLPEGEYVVWVEVSKEFDQNDHYDYPEPEGIPWVDYGMPYRGQPSVVYTIPFSLSAGAESVTSTAEYAGYGDPDGLDVAAAADHGRRPHVPRARQRAAVGGRRRRAGRAGRGDRARRIAHQRDPVVHGPGR
jgi:hypothetical protein